MEDKQRQYIAFLQERNRLKRELDKRRTKETRGRERRERGFQTHLSGANEARGEETRGRSAGGNPRRGRHGDRGGSDGSVEGGRVGVQGAAGTRRHTASSGEESVGRRATGGRGPVPRGQQHGQQRGQQHGQHSQQHAAHRSGGRPTGSSGSSAGGSSRRPALDSRGGGRGTAEAGGQRGTRSSDGHGSRRGRNGRPGTNAAAEDDRNSAEHRGRGGVNGGADGAANSSAHRGGAEGGAWAVRRSKVYFKTDTGQYVAAKGSSPGAAAQPVVSDATSDARAASGARATSSSRPGSGPAASQNGRLSFDRATATSTTASASTAAAPGDHSTGVNAAQVEEANDEVDYEEDYEEESDEEANYLEESFEDDDDDEDNDCDEVTSSLLSAPGSSALVVDVMRSVTASDISALRRSLAGALAPPEARSVGSTTSAIGDMEWGRDGSDARDASRASVQSAEIRESISSVVTADTDMESSFALTTPERQRQPRQHQTMSAPRQGEPPNFSNLSNPADPSVRPGAPDESLSVLRGGVRVARGSFSDKMRRYRPPSSGGVGRAESEAESEGGVGARRSSRHTTSPGRPARQRPGTEGGGHSSCKVRVVANTCIILHTPRPHDAFPPNAPLVATARVHSPH